MNCRLIRKLWCPRRAHVYSISLQTFSRKPSGKTLIYRYAVSDQSEKLKFRHSSPYSHVQPHFVAMTHFKSSFSEGTQLPTRVGGNSHIYINACVRFSLPPRQHVSNGTSPSPLLGSTSESTNQRYNCHWSKQLLRGMPMDRRYSGISDLLLGKELTPL